MFRKPFKIRHNTQLKGSCRKRFRLDILKTFPSLSNDKLCKLIPNKENVFCLKISTHSDVMVNVYCVQKIPLVFELADVMYPTVYMLWEAPELLPVFTTHPEVFSFIAGGADLMLPGVILPEPITPNSYGNLEKGSRVCVTLKNNRAPMAVGVTALSSSDMFMANKRGKCVSVFHFYGDHLSSLETLLPIPFIQELNEEVKISEATEMLKIAASDSSDISPDSDSPIAIDESPQESRNSVEENILMEESQPSGTDENQNIEEQMNELLMYCFLKSLKTSAKKVSFPLLTSNFFRLHLLAACPESKSLELKKTKYKKLSNFLEEMEGLQLIKLETVSKGVLGISSINYDHESLKTFSKTYSHIEAEDKKPDENEQTTATLRVEEKYCVNAATLPLFSLYLYKKQDVITKDSVRNCIRDYVERQNLVDPNDKRLIRPDDVLKKISGQSESVGWAQLIEAVTKKLGDCYSVHAPDRSTAVVKGKLSPIDIQVGTRSCNKKVTLVNNLELYGINIKEFCQECQHGVAASTTINHPPSLKSAQVQVQGNQVAFVSKLLMEKYNIPKRMIRGMENIPKKKK
ncbi:hypothetical protein LSTR_LSTR004212 [Laodelphax striatellus]|uniref:Uncharacterized protein n=1 Tax=Laodelphax striatellus TaxID=195883 RepID=A0A482X9B7_LAOST|nr:hypothetical protein LSTR_LSTR004212 [Laodelphax striatellus]